MKKSFAVKDVQFAGNSTVSKGKYHLQVFRLNLNWFFSFESERKPEDSFVSLRNDFNRDAWIGTTTLNFKKKIVKFRWSQKLVTCDPSPVSRHPLPVTRYPWKRPWLFWSTPSWWDHLTLHSFGSAVWRLWIWKIQTVRRKSLLLSEPSMFYQYFYKSEVSRQRDLTKMAAVNFLASKNKQ